MEKNFKRMIKILLFSKFLPCHIIATVFFPMNHLKLHKLQKKEYKNEHRRDTNCEKEVDIVILLEPYVFHIKNCCTSSAQQ